MFKNIFKFEQSLLILLGMLATGYFAHHVYLDNKYERAFNETSVGESLNSVLLRFGEPTDIAGRLRPEESGRLPPCVEQCQLRLWYLAPILGGVSPYSIDFDAKQSVVAKFHWMSP